MDNKKRFIKHESGAFMCSVCYRDEKNCKCCCKKCEDVRDICKCEVKE